ncbi:MAG: hypothetical protein AB8G14_10255 [Ilumatobacter sp.]
MADSSLPALAALIIGAVGLLACWVAMTHKLRPPQWWQWWKPAPHHTPPAESVPEPAVPRRRVVTGAAAADRLGHRRPPGRHLPFRPDLLRYKRQRLGVEESQRVIEHALQDDPKRVADAIEQMLAEDQQDPTWE